MADVDEGFSPVPALSEPLNADDELRLQDALADDPGQDQQPPAGPVPLGRSPAYDFVGHRFLPGAAGGPLMVYGLETLKVWIEKCARTRRGAHPAVDPDFGCDLIADDLLEEGEPFDPSLVAEYTSALERGLLVHPRIAAIEDITVTTTPDDDAVLVQFTVVVDGDEVEEVPFNLTLGA